jgi:glycerophosphoryl diester phosphodiesterase
MVILMFIAHRGCVTNNIKENSLAAFNLAISNPKYQGFELDIRETKDHEFVVTHDFLYHNKLISKTNLKDLESLGLISLKTVLKLDTDKIILIDIKDYELNVTKLSILLNKYHKNIYVMSFYNKLITKIKTYAKEFKCGSLNYFYNKDLTNPDFDFITLLNSSVTSSIIDNTLKHQQQLFSFGIIDNIKYPNIIYYIIDNYQDYVIK